MPEKQNESKFMSMLERKGLVRKTGNDCGHPEQDPASAQMRQNSDIRDILGAPENDPLKVTPASRQPIPGMVSPVFPDEHPQGTQRENSQSATFGMTEPPLTGKPITAAPLKYDQAGTPEPPKADLLITTEPSSAEPSQATETLKEDLLRTVDPPSTESPLSASINGESGSFSESHTQNEQYTMSEGYGANTYEQPQPEDYTGRYLDIDDLYNVLSIRSKRTDTIYLVEEYIKSLPDSLPEESRRDIVGKIVSASGFDYDLLLGDGVLRVKMLKEYAERFANHTDNYVAACQAQIEDFEQQINTVHGLIEKRRELHKRQFFAIEAEAQRLKEILSFISG